MEFNEKLAELRQKKGMTQEELAAALFVSRTAVSKWESGRGYPNIESLKQIARVFSVTVDDLLSSDELISIAEEDKSRVKSHYKRLVFGLSDVAAALLFLLPLFGDRGDSDVIATSLLSLTAASFYIKFLYFAFVILSVVWGVLILVVNNKPFFGKISFILSLLGLLLFTASLQPYAAVFVLAFLLLKALSTRRVSQT